MTSRTTRLLPALAAGVLLIAGAGPVQAQPDSPDRTGALPTTITGKGFGHGKGLSQYGARYRAENNQTPSAILDFYYRGTTAATTGGKIRVLVTADTDDNTKVKAARGLKLTDTGRGRTYRLPTSRHPKAWRLKIVNGQTRVHYKTGRWHRYRPGGRATLSGDGQFSSSTGVVTLKLPTGTRDYRGALRLANRDTLNVVGLEKYLRGVVPAEMPASWHQNALQAQAVAARTYAAFERADRAASYFHVYDTTRSQVYGGLAAEEPQTNAAITATARQIRTHGGRPAFTQFSASNGGYSMAGSQPYLVADADTFDLYPEWTRTFGAADITAIEQRYPTLGALQGITVTSRDGNGSYGGRVLTLTLDGSVNDVIGVTGDDFRFLLGLRSTLFTIS